MRRIVPLEDHGDVRRAFAALLRMHGYSVADFASADEAEAHLEECDADIALLDVRMPGRTGPDLAKHLAVRCPGIRIVYVTGEANIDALKQTTPGALVVHKPVDVDVVLTPLQSL